MAFGRARPIQVLKVFTAGTVAQSVQLSHSAELTGTYRFEARDGLPSSFRALESYMATSMSMGWKFCCAASFRKLIG